jgi:hypothetical protein
MHAGVCSPRIESDRPRRFIGVSHSVGFNVLAATSDLEKMLLAFTF